MEDSEKRKMDELIRKQDVLEIKFKDGILVQEDGVYIRVDKVVEKIKAMPPVQPKRGKWIERRTWSEGYGMGETYGKYWACNQCGREVKGFWNECGKNFCDNCGADMTGNDDGTD